MNSEKALINRIRTLREIAPDNDWVVSCKMRIMGPEAMAAKSSPMIFLRRFVFQYRAALAGLILAAGAGGGLLVSAQNALPGEPLYGLKKATEKGSAMVMGQVRRGESAVANLRLAAKRLEEIDIISRRNLAQNLPAAMDEYQAAKTEAKKEVAALVKKNPQKAGEIAKQAARAMKEINDREKQVYTVLGAEPGAGEEDLRAEVVLDKQIIESLILYLNAEEMLSQEEIVDLNEVRKLYSAGDYSKAIDYYLTSSLNN